MINIVSRSVVSKNISGPQKVVHNLIKGLDIIGYPYCINKALDATSQLWIHDDQIALEQAAKLKLNAVVGPNIFTTPKNIPDYIDFSHFVYIHPSKWAADAWKDFGFNKCPMDSWPTGIDTEEFNERKKPENGLVSIYFKERYPEELDYVKKILEENNIKYEIIYYRHYNQKNYLEKLRNTKYVIWIGRQESQGIALEEAMSMNVPILVWDVLNLGHWVPANKKDTEIFTKEELAYKNATSAYYFDDRCGIKTKNKDDMKLSIEKMEINWKKYTPREYIIENLSLKKQAKELINLYDKYFNINYTEGEKEILKNNKKWKNDYIQFKIIVLFKSLIKNILGRKG